VQDCSKTAETAAVDLETLDRALLFAGRGDFIRVACTPEGPVDPATLTGPLVAHNGFGFDFHALGVDLFTRELVDTMILGMLDHPPLGRRAGKDALKDYGLDAMAARYGIEGKSADVAALARQHGGFDRIPLDVLTPYCVNDARIARALLDKIGMTDYARREMAIMGRLSGAITGIGFAVDEELLAERMEAGDARRRALTAQLVERYGMPTGGKAPHATRAGKLAIANAFADLGVVLPSTASGEPALGKSVLEGIDGPAAELRDVVLALNGVRSVYGTIAANVVGGRVHPSVVPVQASGRFSVWDPGLTVMGKRGGKHVERDVLVADEGCLLVAFDLNQIDARAVAVHSQDPEYLKLFTPGVDSHTEVAMALWGDPARREQAKAIAHGWNYGEGIRKLVLNTGLPEETVRQFDRGMRERFPRLVEWRTEVYESGRQGVLLDNGFGRQLKVDPQYAYTQAPAYMGQSTARDLMCHGVLRLPVDVARMVRAFIHDELVLSVPEDSVEDVCRVVLDALTFTWAPPGARHEVEVTAGASRPARSWGRCYEK
jgi:DNA polymerase-1